MKRHIPRCLTSFGLMFFFALVFSLITPAAKAKAGEVTGSIPSEQISESAEVSDTPEETKPAIKLNVKTKFLVKEKSYALKVYNVSDGCSIVFKSDNPEIASVNEEGLVTAKTVGTAVITVLVKDSSKIIATLQCEIIVGPPAVSIKLVRTEITLSVGKRTTLKTILQPNNTVEEAKFYSYDPEVAAVSAGGRITAKSPGTTYIYVGIDNGKYDLCKVTVVEKDLSDDSDTTENGSVLPDEPEEDAEEQSPADVSVTM